MHHRVQLEVRLLLQVYLATPVGALLWVNALTGALIEPVGTEGNGDVSLTGIFSRLRRSKNPGSSPEGLSLTGISSLRSDIPPRLRRGDAKLAKEIPASRVLSESEPLGKLAFQMALPRTK